ncbi:MAG: hypothetical protein ACOC2N_01760 [Spirochaetota bacterium]
MRPAFRALVVATLAALALLSCENTFTTSPLAFLQRDPANLSTEQQKEYAYDALASGDEDKMAEAYALLKDSDDAATQIFASELALGAAGLQSAVTTALGDVGGGEDTSTVLEETLAGFTADDLVLMEEAAALLDAADETVTPTPEQYAFAAIGLMAVAVDENGGSTTGLDGLAPGDPGYEETQQAEVFLEAAAAALQADGESTDLLDNLLGVIQAP